ncbi:MAG: lysylphosphatidylglycerol synthase domain-containing protein [Elainella sp. Prado103]|jgi:hypothetical protein|nr:lysylphosphatidylglycerol synthase domain-containing protein [Elainella sp. Prado103]
MAQLALILTRLKRVLQPIRPYLRWLIVGLTLFFIASMVRQHWQEVRLLRLRAAGWQWLLISLSFTLSAHLWTGWVWSWILQILGQPVPRAWSMAVYLRTNIAKYLPGNVWHLYGRVVAAKEAGFSIGAATLSVVLEPLLMVAAALILAVINVRQNVALQLLGLAIVLLAIHPQILNPLLRFAQKLKGKPRPDRADASSIATGLQIQTYPIRPLLGELGFVLLRGIGMVAALQAIQSLDVAQIPLILSVFSIAWVMGLVIPGAPGGIGVFEAIAIALLTGHLPASLILGGVALYRLISILAEVIGAGLAYGKRFGNP